MDNAKIAFARKVQETAAELAQLENLMTDMFKIYNDRNYAPGLPNQYTTEELAALESAGGRKITSEDLNYFLLLCQQITGLLSGQPAVQFDYMSIINRARNDI
jgi:hypothetical protein